MTPYYQAKGVTIYCGDALDVLPVLVEKSADLLVTDPPYGVNWQSGHRTTKFDRLHGDDGSIDVIAILAASFRVLRPFRHLYVFGPADLSTLPVGGSSTLIWQKGGSINGGNTALPWAPSHEPITFGVYAPSKANRDRGDGIGAARLRRGSVINVPRLNSTQNSNHPTEKPVKLLRILIESSSTFDETVLDPFAGSGSTLEAAVREGRQAIGVEINEQFCEYAAKRIEALG
jgi:DNA modification methylase